MTSSEIQKVLSDLMQNNLFLCDYSEESMCLKNEKGEVVFSFKLSEEMTTLQSLRFQLNNLKRKIDDSFKLIEPN